MERMLVVVFDTENQAFQAKTVLGELSVAGIITDYADAVIVKNSDGSTAVEQVSHRVPVGTVGGSALGSLIGLLGGPVGLGIGAGAGLLAGIIADLYNARIGADFVDDVLKELTPGKYALAADIEEPSTEALERRMESIGGKVFRRSRSEVRHSLHERHVAAMKAEIAELQAELAAESAGHRSRLTEKINRLESQIEAQLEWHRLCREAAERDAWFKADARRRKAETLKAVAAAVPIQDFGNASESGPNFAKERENESERH